MMSAGVPPDETLDELYEHAPCGYLTVDTTGRIARVNATLLDWLGAARDTVLGNRLQSLLTPAGCVFFETHVMPTIAAEGVARQVAIDLECGQGRRLPALTTWSRVDIAGQAYGMRVMVVDASERRAYERDLIAAREDAQRSAIRLGESEARLRQLNESLERRVDERTNELRDSRDFARLALSAVGGVGVWTYEVATDSFTCDASISKLYDIDPVAGAAGISRIDFLANVHDDDRPALQATMASGLTQSGDLELEYRLVHRDGSVHWVLSRGHTYHDAEGRAVRRTGVGVDMTKPRELEQQLRQSQKMEAVGQLTGGIAHDFNNLLQGITGSLDIIETRLKAGRVEDLARWVSGAKTSAERAAALTHRLLAFSRRQPIDPRAVAANPLVLSMVDLLNRTLGGQIRLDLDLDDDLWRARCDPNQLESAILNLAINARDAMPAGGTLRIATRNADLSTRQQAHKRGVKPGHYICLSVADDGIGMTDDTIAKAFEPFFTTKPIGQGTGLGLSMIYGFARQSEGRARIASAVGAGTTVSLYLPRHLGAASAHPPSPVASPAAAAPAGGTVLIIEDEPLVRALVVEILRELGFGTIEASDGQSGLDIIARQPTIDLLVTDIGLPGLNGRQVADAARVFRPDLRILFMTGYAENAAVAAGFLHPGMAMITKPFENRVMADRIRHLLE